MPLIYKGGDHVVAGFVSMGRGYRMQYMNAQAIWMYYGDPASVIFLGCARQDHHQSDFDSTFVLMMMNGVRVKRSLLLLNYLSNYVSASCEHHMYHLSKPQVLCPGKDVGG